MHWHCRSYLGAFAVGHYFLDGLAYQVADGDGRFCIGWSFYYRYVFVAVDFDVAVSDVGNSTWYLHFASNTML
jgi:hypothetical protein